MQIVEQTKHRSGWRVYRTLGALGVPRSVYYAWKGRDSLEDQTAKPCRVYEVLPEERAAICEFALQYPKIGYRKLTWMMVDAGTACVGESTVYRILSDADLLSRWKRSRVSNGEYNFRPKAPNQQWHTDVMYVWAARLIKKGTVENGVGRTEKLRKLRSLPADIRRRRDDCHGVGETG